MIRRFGSVLTVAAVLAVCAPVPAGAATLEGVWRLQEQHYGNGRANQADPERPVHLEFRLDAGTLAATIRAADWDGDPLAWPAAVTDDGPRPVEVLERETDLLGGEVRVRYLVPPSPTDDLVLDIVEHYRLVEDSDTLEGTVTITFTRDGRTRGSYVLHRRFVREP